MAATVAAAFAKLKENLEITGLQAETVSTRQQVVRSAMEAGLSVLDSFLTGSYAKDTMISPLAQADIDIFVVLASEYYNRHTPSSLLAEVRRVLRGRYPQTPEISPDGQAVTISFTDFNVDVVPAFHRQGGGFLIPNSPSGWIATDPKVHLDHLTRENRRHGGLLVPLIKMMKGWSRARGGILRGFYLELMTMKVLSAVTLTEFPSGLRYVFDKGREAVKYTVLDPAGFGDEVAGLKGISVNQAVAHLQATHDIAVSAEQMGQYGFPRSAIDEWRKLFGDYFPAYG